MKNEFPLVNADFMRIDNNEVDVRKPHILGRQYSPVFVYPFLMLEIHA